MAYKDFIDTISTDDFAGFNAIEYADGGLEYYVSVQAVLKWIGEYANLISNGSEIIHVDWESDKPMFMYSTTLSCDLGKCYVRNGYLRNSVGTFDDKSGIPKFKNVSSFKDSKYASLNETLKEEAGTIEDTSIYPQVGNINYIYLSTYNLSQLITKGSDNKDNKITIRKFLQDICDGMNKALGSINDFQVISNPDGVVENLTIIDYQQKRVKGLAAKFKETDRDTTTLQTQGLGTMLTKIQAQSSITPELADMIAIGAQAQNQPVGEEAASFSLLSKGLTDRIYPSKTIGDTDLVKQEKERKEAIESDYEEALSAYANLLGNQQPTGEDAFNPVSLKSTEVSNVQNIAVELYKACLGMFTETGQTSTAFIPIKVNLSLYGISGIKIYQKFKLSNNVLPLSYKGNFEFIVLGVSHTVDSSRWETNISALITLADEPLKKDGPLKPFSVRAKKLKPGLRATGSQPAGCPAPGTNIVKNGWEGKEQPFKRTVLTYEQAKAAIVAAAPGNKNLQIAVLAVIIQEQGRGGKIKGFNHNYGGFDITRGGWKFTTIGDSNTDGYVIATEGGTKCKIAYVSFKEAASFFKVKINSFKRKGFDKPLTGKQVANLWYTKWNGFGSRLFWQNNTLGYKKKYPTIEQYDKFVVSNFEKNYYNVAKKLIG